MKCDSCQKKATVFYTQVTDGKLKKFVLCESCAEAKGITNPEGLLMAEELLGSNEVAQSGADLFPLQSLESCSACGFTLVDFQKVGRLGCPDCYRAFFGEITKRLPSMHKGTKHTGHMPVGLVKEQALRDELSGLESKLEAAVRDENFEEAAKLRDRINEIENANQEGVAAQ